MEVKNLEKYLLSKYRKTFEKTASSYTSMETISKTTADTLDDSSKHIVKGSSMLDSMTLWLPQAVIKNPDNNCSGIFRVQPLLDSSIQYRSHSSLSQSAACSYRISPPRATNAEAMHSFHSLPLSMLEVIFVYRTCQMYSFFEAWSIVYLTLTNFNFSTLFTSVFKILLVLVLQSILLQSSPLIMSGKHQIGFLRKW